MKKTFQQVLTFLSAADAWLQRNPKEECDTKFHYAVMRVFKRALTVQSDYREKLLEIDIENCATDDKGVILREPSDDPNNREGNFRFTKDGIKKRNKDRLLAFKSETEIEPHYCAEIPADLSDDEREVFTGFVIKEEAEKAEGATG